METKGEGKGQLCGYPAGEIDLARTTPQPAALTLVEVVWLKHVELV